MSTQIYPSDSCYGITRSRRRKTTFLCILVLAAWSSHGKPVNALQQPETGSASASASQDSDTLTLPAGVEGEQTVDLFAKVGGYLKTISVDIGDEVKRGQALIQLHVPEQETRVVQHESLVEQAKAEYRQAGAAVGEAEARLESQLATVEETKTLLLQRQAFLNYETAEFERVSRLVESGAINRELQDTAKLKRDGAAAGMKAAGARVRTSEAGLVEHRASVTRAEADMDSARSRIKVAEANLQYEQAMLDYATLRAPFDGLITKRWFDPGAFIQSADGNSAAQPVVQITRTDSVRIVVQISMAQAHAMRAGDRAVFGRIDGMPDESFEGTVSRLSTVLDNQSRMMRLEVDLPNPEGKLRPGYFGYVTIYLSR